VEEEGVIGFGIAVEVAAPERFGLRIVAFKVASEERGKLGGKVIRLAGMGPPLSLSNGLSLGSVGCAVHDFTDAASCRSLKQGTPQTAWGDPVGFPGPLLQALGWLSKIIVAGVCSVCKQKFQIASGRPLPGLNLGHGPKSSGISRVYLNLGEQRRTPGA
jgi:hypothetical protein